MWQQSSPSWPTSAQAIQTQTELVTNQVAGTMTGAVNRLKALETDATYTRHPLSEAAQGLLNLRTELNVLQATGTVLTVTPYQFQVGNKIESGHYLNPQQATQILITKLRDQVDHHRPKGQQYAVAIMMTASRLDSFARQLTDITQVFNLPEWCQTARQATALLTNEYDKFEQPAPIVLPRFKPQGHINPNPLRAALKEQGSQIATLESLADDKNNVINKLQGLSTKRASKLAEVKASINALKALNGSVWSTKFTGSLDSMASQLTNTDAPTNDQYTIMSLLLSDKPLTFFEELLNA